MTCAGRCRWSAGALNLVLGATAPVRAEFRLFLESPAVAPLALRPALIADADP
ncbi:MAG: hypothetical protein U1F68_20915 [Gammaproteobacteria bacterium]